MEKPTEAANQTEGGDHRTRRELGTRSRHSDAYPEASPQCRSPKRRGVNGQPKPMSAPSTDRASWRTESTRFQIASCQGQRWMRTVVPDGAERIWTRSLTWLT